jgi:hypothetical protein
MVNASSLTFSDITVNSIFSLNNTIFSHYTLEQIKNSVIDSSNISSLIDNVSSSNVSITNINSTISSINTELNNLSTVNTSVNNLITDVTSHNTSLTDLNTTVLSLVTDLNNLSTVNTSLTDLTTDVTSHNTSLTDLNTSVSLLNTSITNIQTKTDLIDLSGSTVFTFGANMSSIYIGDASSSVYIGGEVHTGNSTSLSNPFIISYTPSNLTSNTMVGYMLSDTKTVTQDSTQITSNDYDSSDNPTYISYGLVSNDLASITLPSGVWMVDWLMDVYDSSNNLDYNNYIATGVAKNTPNASGFNGTNDSLHPDAARQLATRAGNYEVDVLTSSSFYVGSYYIGKFTGLNLSTKTGTFEGSDSNYSRWGSRSVITNSFMTSITSSTNFTAFFGMAGQPFTFGDIVFTSKINATRIG